MEEAFAKVEDMSAHIKEYVNNRMDSAKLNVAEKSSDLIAKIIAIAAAMLVFIFFILFASIALAYVFAKLTGEFYWGFLIVAGIYLLLGMMVWVAKERLLRLPIMNFMLQQLFKEEGEEDEED